MTTNPADANSASMKRRNGICGPESEYPERATLWIHVDLTLMRAGARRYPTRTPMFWETLPIVVARERSSSPNHAADIRGGRMPNRDAPNAAKVCPKARRAYPVSFGSLPAKRIHPERRRLNEAPIRSFLSPKRSSAKEPNVVNGKPRNWAKIDSKFT